MSHDDPPRLPQRLLESVGADREFTDAVIGDMNEEFWLRREYDGPRAARRWYRRQALRSLPYFVRNWAASLRMDDAGDIARAVIGAYVIDSAVCGVVMSLALSAFRAAGVQLGGPLDLSDPIVRFVAVPVFGLIAVGNAVFGGYLAAWLTKRAPLASALVLGAVATTLGAAAALVFRATNPAPIALTLVQLAAISCCTTAGGLLRVWTTARRAVTTDSRT